MEKRASEWPFYSRVRSSADLDLHVKTYILIFPISLLMAASQLLVKWRSNAADHVATTSFAQQCYKFLVDPVIWSAYAAGLLASFVWLLVVAKLPVTTAFPIYIGFTFVMVLFGGCYFLSETLSVTKLCAVLLIISGIFLGLRADA